MNTCTRCRNDNHDACDGGAWDDDMKPTVCECYMAWHGIPQDEDDEEGVDE